MNTTREEMDAVRGDSDFIYDDFVTVEKGVLARILDDADRCAEMEAEVKRLRDGIHKALAEREDRSLALFLVEGLLNGGGNE